MREVSFSVGRNNRKVQGFLHEDLSPYCETVKRRPAMIVCPGGAYMHLSPREAEPVAFRYFARGYNVFILWYSIGDLIEKEMPLRELAECVDTVRRSADEYLIDENMISVIGFSAGGHLVASLATMWDEELCAGFNAKVSSVILGYPVITAGEYAHLGSLENISRSGYPAEFWSLENRVKPSTVPCFIFHSADDPTVPLDNALLYMSALRKNGVFFESHIYPTGGHGFSTATREVGSDFPHDRDWVEMSLEFIEGITGWRE